MANTAHMWAGRPEPNKQDEGQRVWLCHNGVVCVVWNFDKCLAKISQKLYRLEFKYRENEYAVIYLIAISTYELKYV